MTATGDLLRLSRDLQATALVGRSVRLAKKKKKKTKDFVKNAVTNIAGIPLIRVQGQLSAGL